MGRRKAAKKAIKKKRATVAKVFKCLRCNSDDTVTCSMDFGSMTGNLICRICDVKFSCTINSLSEPIDVFSEWIDQAEELKQESLGV